MHWPRKTEGPTCLQASFLRETVYNGDSVAEPKLEPAGEKTLGQCGLRRVHLPHFGETKTRWLTYTSFLSIIKATRTPTNPQENISRKTKNLRARDVHSVCPKQRRALYTKCWLKPAPDAPTKSQDACCPRCAYAG